jgi:tetratricopeptide (TPR) repeat protein
MRMAMLVFPSVLLAQGISVSQIDLALPDQPLAQAWGVAAAHPRSVEARADVASALLASNRLQQAEWAARESVELDPSNARAQFLLGWTLTREYRYTAEALDCLRRAAASIPEAHLAAADVLVHQSQTAQARAEVEAYLASGAPAHRRTAEAWLKLLAN